ncbi:MAG: hypothetical protein KME04_10525 [Pleurocapsa minor GSE-CHR-MK-17-07R]|nr:hypothetical protein [Pleurocapsa minor GSE-CHR-MK 17-07R]
MTLSPSLRFRRLTGFVFAALALLIAAGCAPAASTSASMQTLPTLAVLPSEWPIENAERVAREFMQNWQDGQYERMFELISFGSQEATPSETFINTYADAASAMELVGVTVTPTGIYRESDAIAVFNYSVDMITETFGTITLANRDMRLVVDAAARDWRVAWTPGDLFPELASGGRLRLRSAPPIRANIYDASGDVLADQEGRVATISVVRQSAPEWENCLNTLSATLVLPLSDVRLRLESRPASELVQIGTIDEATYNAVAPQLDAFCDARLDGVRVRRYPTGTTVSNLLGYVGYPSEAEIPALEATGFTQESLIGRTGIELAWDETLRGTPAASLEIVSPSGQVMRVLGERQARPGQSLWLTVDADLQNAVYNIVADAYTQAKDTWAPASGGASVVVMDVTNGDVLAMVTYPTFDNNAYNAFPTMGRQVANEMIQAFQADPRRPELNRPAQGVFTLGSVMKTITAAAAADSGVYAVDERYTCSGLWNRDIVRTDWLPGGHGLLTLAGSLTQSCNPYYYEAGYQLYQADPYILPDYARRFGFGVLTGIPDIPEQPGFIPDPDWFRISFGTEMPFSEEVNMAIGQGYVQVTPLQVTRWTAAIANGGTLYRPHLVSYTGLLGGEPTPAYEPEGIDLDLQPEVIDMLHSGMCAVTNTQAGTAEFVFRNSPLQALGVCGKTGTAQTGGPGTPSHAWFASYAPQDNPQIAVVVLVETSGEGSGVAAPIARQVHEYYFGFAD